VLVRQGPVFVTFFFVLSGFILTVAYPALADATARRRFWRARFARIYPVYLLALAITIALQMRQHDVPWLAAIGQASLLQGFVPAWVAPLNYPGWSLCAEAFFYAGFPWLLAWLSARRSVAALLLPVIALWVVTQATYMIFLGVEAAGGLSPNGAILLRFNPVLYLSSFAWGIAAALLLRHRTAWIEAHPWAANRGAGFLAIASVVVIAGGLYAVPSSPTLTALHVGTDHCLFAPLFAIAIVALAVDRSSLARMLSWAPLVALGEASYAVYILQAPVWTAFQWLVGPRLASGLGLGPGGAFLAFVALLTSVSVIVLYAFEKPMRAWLRGAPAPRVADAALTRL
jgi:peptidoglycan/LPS O-acetylase OafA/YrhL